MENLNTDNTGNTPSPGNNGLSKKTIGIIAAVLIVALGIILAVVMMKKDPKDTIVNALGQMTSSKEESAFSKTLGLKELVASTEPTETNMKLTLDKTNAELGVPAFFNNSSITTKTIVDNVEGNMMMSAGMQLAGLDLGEYKIYMDQKELALGAPALTKKVLTFDHNKDLKAAVAANPYLATMLDLDDSDYTMINEYFDVLRTALKNEEKTNSFENIINNYRDALQTKKDVKAMLENVTKLEAETFTYNGKEVKANGYEATITRDSLAKHLEDSKNYVNTDEKFKADMLQVNPTFYDAEALEQWNKTMDLVIGGIKNSHKDLILKVYVDKAGNLISVSMSKDIVAENESVDLNFVWNLEGGNTRFENSNGSLQMKDTTGEEITLKFKKTGNTANDKFDTTFNVELSQAGISIANFGYEGDYLNESGAFNFVMKVNAPDAELDMAFVVKGNISDLEPGKAATFTFNDIALNVSGTDIANLKGSYDYKPLVDKATRPEGTDLDVLTAGEKEWDAFGEEVEKAFDKLFEQFMGKMFTE